MSFAWKLIQGFMGLGGIGVISLVTAKPEDPIRYFEAPPTGSSQSIEGLKKEGYRDCRDLKGFRETSLLFVCWYYKISGSLEPSFFHYNRLRVKETLKRVVHISPNREMRFADNSVETLKWSPFWLRSTYQQGLTPDKDCTITQKGNNTVFAGELSCKNSTLKQTL